jgi:hypothetical protein
MPAESNVDALDLSVGRKFQGIIDQVNKNLHEGVLIDEHGGRREIIGLTCGGKLQGKTSRVGLR